MFGVIMPLCNRMFCCIFGWYFYIEIRLKYEKNILLSSSRAFSLSTPTFSLSTPVENNEATWKKVTKCNKLLCFALHYIYHSPTVSSSLYYFRIFFQSNMTHTDYLQVSHTQTGTTKNCNIQSENEYVSLEQYS